ncbi:MAG TPA: hypothetical protein VHR18_13440 [Solirubrobacterales bacterium]|nr:hypothetical protein [Solirubrobacterales bacterium]
MFDQEKADNERRARARGEGIRDELLARLEDGPQTAAALLPQIGVSDVSLSEVAFQLDRLADERRTVGEQGAEYRLA